MFCCRETLKHSVVDANHIETYKQKGRKEEENCSITLQMSTSTFVNIATSKPPANTKTRLKMKIKENVEY
jgi:hypothetical protein